MCKEQEKSLHSRYNPQGEADRYIASLSLNEKARYFILIEPGLGYMAAPLRKRAPEARLIALHVEKQSLPGPEGFDSQWHPELGISLRYFLEKEIQDCEAKEIQLLEWRPALSVYGKAYFSLIEEAVDFIKRADANVRTIKTFGNRWFRNFFRNLKIIKKIVKPVSISMPLFITGSGPSLEEQIPIIKKQRRSNIFILAASSSQMALKAAGLTPDMVIATDGSPWAALHLFEGFRGGFGLPLAASLTASLPSQCEKLCILPICDGSLWQTIILKKFDIPFITLPQRGTVTAAALDLAFAITDREVIITGMDLANRDLRSHARPYGFDQLLEDKEKRFNPVYSQRYKRSSLLQAGGSFEIYAAWFKKQLESYPKRLYSLGENNLLFNFLKIEALKEEFETKKEKPSLYETISLNSGTFSSKNAVAVLKEALSDCNNSSRLSEELAPLLLPAETSPSVNELIEALNRELGFE